MEKILKKQTFWLYSFLILITLLVVSYSIFFHFRKVTIHNELKKLKNIRENLTSQIDNYFLNSLNKINVIVKSGKSLDALQGKLSGLNKSELKDFQDVLLISPTGQVIFSLKNEIPLNTDIYKNHKYSLLSSLIDQIKNSTEPAISNFDYLENSKQPSLFIGVPLYFNKKYSGSLLVKVNHNDINNIVKENFNFLSATGDLLVAKKSGKKSLVIFSSKFNPDSAFSESFNLNEINPINLALLGSQATEIIDVYGSKILNSRSILKMVPWAISIEENLQDVISKFNIFKIFLFIILILSIITFLIFLRLALHGIIAFVLNNKFKIIYSITLILLIFLIILFAFRLKNYNENKLNLTNKNFLKTKLQIEEIGSLLQQHLNSIKNLTISISQDLSSEKLTNETWDKFLQNTFEKNPFIFGVSIIDFSNKNKNLIKFFINENDKTIVKQLDITTDLENIDWFKNIIDNNKKEENFWVGPILEKKVDDEIFQMNVMPFYTKDKKQIKGIAAVLYSYSTIADTISLLGQKTLENSIIYNDNEKIIFYENKDFILQDSNLNDLLNKLNINLDLFKKKNEQKNYSGYFSFFDKKNNEKKWLFHESIPVANWTLVVFYQNKFFNVYDSNQYKNLIIIIILLSIILIIFAALIFQIYFFDIKKIYIFFIIYALILFVCICSIIFLSRYPLNELEHNIVTNKLELNQLIDEQRNRFYPQENFMPVKVGINVRFIELTGLNTSAFTAYFWQKINKKTQKDIVPGIALINCSPLMDNYIKDEVSNITIDNIQTYTWFLMDSAYNLKSVLKRFPFDYQNIEYIFTSIDKSKNVLLIPDLQDYVSLDPETLPGLSKSTKIPRFEIEKSYFSYNNDFDIQNSAKKPKNLSINVVLKRNLWLPFANFFFPLLVILFTLFSIHLIMLIKSIGTFDLIMAYSGLLFALILVHQSYRSNVSLNQVSFLESFIFLIYLFISISCIEAFFSHNKNMQKIQVYTFWPIFLTLLLILTLIFFYN